MSLLLRYVVSLEVIISNVVGIKEDSDTMKRSPPLIQCIIWNSFTCQWHTTAISKGSRSPQCKNWLQSRLVTKIGTEKNALSSVRRRPFRGHSKVVIIPVQLNEHDVSCGQDVIDTDGNWSTRERSTSPQGRCLQGLHSRVSFDTLLMILTSLQVFGMLYLRRTTLPSWCVTRSESEMFCNASAQSGHPFEIKAICGSVVNPRIAETYFTNQFCLVGFPRAVSCNVFSIVSLCERDKTRLLNSDPHWIEEPSGHHFSQSSLCEGIRVGQLCSSPPSDFAPTLRASSRSNPSIRDVFDRTSSWRPWDRSVCRVKKANNCMQRLPITCGTPHGPTIELTHLWGEKGNELRHITCRLAIGY